jgi:2-polyprenyl-3-methyl-5-hydroxy-6-metoxy-1,4-benzoquinol methylase
MGAGSTKKGNASAWDANATSWTTNVRSGGDLSRKLIINPAIEALTTDIAGRRVLDAGCGEGVHARMLARRRAKVIGVDVAPAMIELARAEERRNPLGIVYRVSAIDSLRGVRPGSIDLVLISMTLMAIAAYDKALARLARTLVPGGRLLAVINHPCFFMPADENYFAPARTSWRFYEGQPEPTMYFHRPLGAYASAIRAAGLVIQDLHEPQLQARRRGRDAETMAIYTKIPLVMIFDCVRL